MAKLAKMEFQPGPHRHSAEHLDKQLTAEHLDKQRTVENQDEHREEFVGPKKLGLEVVAVELGLDDVHGLDNVHGLEVVVVQERTRQDGRLVGDETVVAEREKDEEVEVQKCNRQGGRLVGEKTAADEREDAGLQRRFLKHVSSGQN